MEREQQNVPAKTGAEKPLGMSRRSFLANCGRVGAVAATAGPVFAGTDKFGRDRDWTATRQSTYPEYPRSR
jgi:hypothetical protein